MQRGSDALAASRVKPRVAAYLLAGGRSSRMGQDKAMLSLGGKTLLSIAVSKMRSILALAPPQADPCVTVLGERASLEGADRSIIDSHPGCGPLGGIEAALQDLAIEGNAEWAFFVPVDMPFLPMSLLDALLTEWLQAGREGALTSWCIVGGRPQPLVSLVHRSLYPFVAAAIEEKRHRVAVVLQQACGTVTGANATVSLEQTPILLDGPSLRRTTWSPLPGDILTRDMWFANLNTPEEFREAESRFAS